MDRDLRELLIFLRDTFHDAAGRIDRYLEAGTNPRDRDPPRDRDTPRGRPAPQRDPGARMPLERLREEVRWISTEAGKMDPPMLRLFVEAVTAETRALQPRITDPEDEDIAAKIMRTLTAIVSDHRPGHVYGLARHHQADWDDVARRARAEIRSKNGPTFERAD